MKRDAQLILEPCGLTFARLGQLTDEEIMAHVQAGHDDALTVLFDRYHRLVVSVAFKILRDLGEAEDVTQIVFLEIYKAAAQFDPSRGTTKVWLMQYAYHRSMNRRLYLKRRKFYDQGGMKPRIQGSRKMRTRSAEVVCLFFKRFAASSVKAWRASTRNSGRLSGWRISRDCPSGRLPIKRENHSAT